MAQSLRLQKLGLLLASLVLMGLACNRQPVSSPLPISISRSSPSGPISQEKVNLTINFGEGEVSSYSGQLREGMSVFDLLAEGAGELGFELSLQPFDFGILVKAIDQRENTPEKAWIYFVNGQSGQVAADQAKLESGDQVEWRYLKPN